MGSWILLLAIVSTAYAEIPCNTSVPEGGDSEYGIEVIGNEQSNVPLPSPSPQIPSSDYNIPSAPSPPSIPETPSILLDNAPFKFGYFPQPVAPLVSPLSPSAVIPPPLLPNYAPIKSEYDSGSLSSPPALAPLVDCHPSRDAPAPIPPAQDISLSSSIEYNPPLFTSAPPPAPPGIPSLPEVEYKSPLFSSALPLPSPAIPSPPSLPNYVPIKPEYDSGSLPSPALLTPSEVDCHPSLDAPAPIPPAQDIPSSPTIEYNPPLFASAPPPAPPGIPSLPEVEYKSPLFSSALPLPSPAILSPPSLPNYVPIKPEYDSGSLPSPALLTPSEVDCHPSLDAPAPISPAQDIPSSPTIEYNTPLFASAPPPAPPGIPLLPQVEYKSPSLSPALPLPNPDLPLSGTFASPPLPSPPSIPAIPEIGSSPLNISSFPFPSPPAIPSPPSIPSVPTIPSSSEVVAYEPNSPAITSPANNGYLPPLVPTIPLSIPNTSGYVPSKPEYFSNPPSIQYNPPLEQSYPLNYIPNSLDLPLPYYPFRKDYIPTLNSKPCELHDIPQGIKYESLPLNINGYRGIFPYPYPYAAISKR